MDEATYRRDHRRSLDDPQGFLAEQAERLDWFCAPTRIGDVCYCPQDIHIRWFEDGTLNDSNGCGSKHRFEPLALDDVEQPIRVSRTT